jgi:hypothetical protein
MKKFTIVALALALALAIVPAAMASPCSPLMVGSVCTLPGYTFTFDLVTVTDFNTVQNVPSIGVSPTEVGNYADLAFSVGGGDTYGIDIHLIYEVQGLAGVVTLDNAFASGSGSISESVCSGPWAGSTCTGILLVSGFGASSPGVVAYSAPFLQNGTYYINKDISDGLTNRGGSGFSEFDDSMDLAPEPSSLVLLGTGLLGAAFLLFRRNRARAGSVA